jgi:hypothetical protein
VARVDTFVKLMASLEVSADELLTGLDCASVRFRDLYKGRQLMKDQTRKRAWEAVETKLPGYLEALQATFAWRLAVEAVEGQFGGLPTTRAELQLDSRFRREFVRQKERVAEMDFQMVTITDNFESYVFEPYAALTLDTPYNSWATS